MRRSRALLYAALCLCVPLPAFALSGGSQTAAPVELSVNATLAECGLAETEIICRIDVDFDSVAGATRYTTSVARPDGSVIDQGTVDAGSTTVWVPYVGNGIYLVEVSAYGEPEERGGEEELLGREKAEAEPETEGKGEDKADAGNPEGSPGGAKGATGEDGEAPPACSKDDGEANAEQREQLAALEQEAEELHDKARTVKDEDRARELEAEIGELEDEIRALEDGLEAHESTACAERD